MDMVRSFNLIKEITVDEIRKIWLIYDQTKHTLDDEEIQELHAWLPSLNIQKQHDMCHYQL